MNEKTLETTPESKSSGISLVEIFSFSLVDSYSKSKVVLPSEIYQLVIITEKTSYTVISPIFSVSIRNRKYAYTIH